MLKNLKGMLAFSMRRPPARLKTLALISIAAVGLIGGLAGGCSKPTESIPAYGSPSAQAGEQSQNIRTACLAVASPYLEAVIRDVFQGNLVLLQLAPPGVCPGHFDLRPSQVEKLKNCELLLRFDFQQALEEKYVSARKSRRHTIVVSVPGGLCVPQSYLAACRQVAASLMAAGIAAEDESQRRLGEIEKRLDELEKRIHAQIEAAGLSGTPVLTSAHQADFCRRLGLRVVAEMNGPDAGNVGDIEQTLQAALAAGVKLVVANQPEGRRAADALAERLQAQVVVFANFPQPDEEQAFDHMLQRNLEALLAVVHPPVQP